MNTRFRTDVETLFLSEMVEDDRLFIMEEDLGVDGIIPTNTSGLFDDSSSEDIFKDDVLYDDELDLF